MGSFWTVYGAGCPLCSPIAITATSIASCAYTNYGNCQASSPAFERVGPHDLARSRLNGYGRRPALAGIIGALAPSR
jgi:hypothetical protein